MAGINMEGFLDKMMSGMNSFLSAKTVVGEPIRQGDTIIIPLVDVSFGMGTGTGDSEKGTKGGGGIGGKLSPSAVLIISKGTTKLVNVKNQDSVTKILDMVPDLINKFTDSKDGPIPLSDDEAMDLAFDRSENLEKEAK